MVFKKYIKFRRMRQIIEPARKAASIARHHVLQMFHVTLERKSKQTWDVGQRRRWWANSKPTLGRIMFTIHFRIQDKNLQ